MQSRIVLATLVGAVVLFATGYVIFDVMVADFYTANAGSATGVDRSPQVVWAVVLGTVMDPVLEGIHGGIGGAAVAAVLGRVGVRRSSPARV